MAPQFRLPISSLFPQFLTDIEKGGVLQGSRKMIRQMALMAQIQAGWHCQRQHTLYVTVNRVMQENILLGKILQKL